MKIPNDLLTNLSSADVAKTLAWWRRLSHEAQLEFVQCWDARTDDTAFHGVSRDGDIEWHELPIELRGRLVDDENRVDDRLARQQLLEFVNNQEEVQFFLVDRQFHICRQHPGARACLRSGLIPKGFRCERSNAGDCPMMQILEAADGRSVELHPRIKWMVSRDSPTVVEGDRGRLRRPKT
ncbi:MAG: hypothetical protein AAF928_04235 [Myxococcota bacterium]